MVRRWDIDLEFVTNLEAVLARRVEHRATVTARIDVRVRSLAIAVRVALLFELHPVLLGVRGTKSPITGEITRVAEDRSVLRRTMRRRLTQSRGGERCHDYLQISVTITYISISLPTKIKSLYRTVQIAIVDAL